VSWEPAWNLTVHDVPTYYVLAGATSALVHNTDGRGHMCGISVTSSDGTKRDTSLERRHDARGSCSRVSQQRGFHAHGASILVRGRRIYGAEGFSAE
jgi:hypothetical protein